MNATSNPTINTPIVSGRDEFLDEAGRDFSDEGSDGRSAERVASTFSSATTSGGGVGGSIVLP
jgi:hypothetical protein